MADTVTAGQKMRQNIAKQNFKYNVDDENLCSKGLKTDGD